MTYSDKLKDPRWQKKRLEIMNRDEFTCQICGDTESTLNVHHYNYHGDPWEIEDNYLKTVCEKCHEYEHEHLNNSRNELTLFSKDLSSDENYLLVLILIHLSEYKERNKVLNYLRKTLKENPEYYNKKIKRIKFASKIWENK